MLSANFKRSEFACQCGCGFDTVDAELIAVLEAARSHFGGALCTITSGNRCRAHNASIPKAAQNSFHIFGKAADHRIEGVADRELYQYYINQYPTKYGIGLYAGRVHIDVGGRIWRR